MGAEGHIANQQGCCGGCADCPSTPSVLHLACNELITKSGFDSGCCPPIPPDGTTLALEVDLFQQLSHYPCAWNGDGAGGHWEVWVVGGNTIIHFTPGAIPLDPPVLDWTGDGCPIQSYTGTNTFDYVLPCADDPTQNCTITYTFSDVVIS